MATSAQAQATKKSAMPEEFDTRPLARYVPKEGLFFYFEDIGVNSQEQAWKKTAAYKMLTETTLGEMLEMMTTQAADQGMVNLPNRKISGADVSQILKHLATHGFVVALNSSKSQEHPAHLTVVVKGAAGREVRPAFSRLMGTIMQTAKPQLVKKGGRSIVVFGSTSADKGDGAAWWAEQNDLVFCPEWDVDTVVSTLEGKTPNAADHPIRTELLRAENGFTPVSVMFIDPSGPPAADAGQMVKLFTDLTKSLNATRIDLRTGFHEDGLMTVTRIKTPRPYSANALAFLNQPGFDKAKLPPLPQGSESFVVLSVDTAKTLDLALKAGNDSSPITTAIDDLKAKSKIDLRKDILAHIGPKMAFYTLPSTGSSKSASTDAGANPLMGMMGGGGNPIGMMGAMLGGTGGQFPRVVLTTEVDDPTTFGKTLDNMIVAVNKVIKERMTEAAAEAPDAGAGAGGAGGPGGFGGPGGANAGDGSGSGAAGRVGAATKGGRRSQQQVPVVAFQLVPGKENEKIYMLNIPSAIASQFPTGFRPTVRISGKYLVIGSTPEVAKQVAEIKPGAWTPSPPLAQAFDGLPPDLIALIVSDPRTTEPENLASLPGTIQKIVTMIGGMAQGQVAGMGGPGAGGPGAMAGGPGGYPGAPGGMPGMPGGRPGGGAVTGSNPAGGGYPGAGPGGYPGAGPGGYPGAPGGMMSGMPGGGGGAPGEGATGGLGSFRFNIAASKLPKADALRSMMFPTTFAIAAGEQDISIVSRMSFPSVGISPSSATSLALVLPAIQAARNAAARAAGVDPAALPNVPGIGGAPAAGAGAGAGVGTPPPDSGRSGPGTGSRPGGNSRGDGRNRPGEP
jgi:hypothetical protein